MWSIVDNNELRCRESLVALASCAGDLVPPGPEDIVPPVTAVGVAALLVLGVITTGVGKSFKICSFPDIPQELAFRTPF